MGLRSGSNAAAPAAVDAASYMDVIGAAGTGVVLLSNKRGVWNVKHGALIFAWAIWLAAMHAGAQSPSTAVNPAIDMDRNVYELGPLIDIKASKLEFEAGDGAR